MAAPRPPEAVKPLISILWSSRKNLEEALLKMGDRLGEIDFQGPDRPFDFTDYYEQEMGSNIQRRIISFKSLVDPGALVETKLFTNQVEDALREPRGRSVNLDAGYLDLHKVVLASGKFGAQKIYLGEGIYADMILRYSKGKFHPFQWCFLDFRKGTFEVELLQIRKKYKSQLHATHKK